MTREWEPGDVALIEAGCHANRRVAIRTGVPSNMGWSYSDTYQGKSTNNWTADSSGVATVVRPLVVIDPEDREQAERLADALLAAMCKQGGDRDTAIAYEVRSHMRFALREFANPTPPKPDEPKGVGAIVTASYQDDDGKGFGPATWASREDGTWVCLTDGLSAVALWPFLRDPALVREGVTE